MDEITKAERVSGSGSQKKGNESRRARSIRFSDSEWETVERAAKERDMNAAEFARHAALGVADGRYRADRGVLPSQYAELIELIFRSTHILVTLKRDEMIREGRGEELDELVKETRKFQESLRETISASARNRDQDSSRL